MKNKYEVHGECVLIFMKRKCGAVVRTIISIDDLAPLKKMDVSFYPTWNPDTNSFYVNYHTYNMNGGKTNKSLHRYLMGDPRGKIIDHINHDTLDNRRSNLRSVNNSQSMQNIRLPNRNTSGYKNVSWHKAMKKWRVRLNKNGREIVIGYFDCVHEAGKSAKLARERIYTHSPENNERKVSL